MSRMIMAFFLALTLTMPAAADKAVSARMKRLLMHYDKILEIPKEERTHIRPAYRVKARNIPQSDIKAWYDLNGERVNIVFDYRGIIQNLPDKATYESNPKIYTNQPRKNIVLAMRIRPKIALDRRMDAADLVKSFHQANNGMDRVTGFWRRFRPTLTGFHVEIPAGSEAVMHMQNGTQIVLPQSVINPELVKVVLDIEALNAASHVTYTGDPFIMRYDSSG